QKAALAKVPEECRDGLIDLRGFSAVIVDHAAVSVPMDILAECPAAPHLHEANAALDQPPRQETAPRKVGTFLLLDPVHGQGVGGFLFQLGGFGNGELHSSGELITANPA